jgi:hypothetical protein
MPIVSGKITPGGAVIDVLIGVSQTRRQLLLRKQFPVPSTVHVRALIDTGASVSGFAPRVFTALDLTPVAKQFVLTPSTKSNEPCLCDFYDVSLSVVAGGQAHPFPNCRVMAADCWLAGEGFEALIGRDILNRCTFLYIGQDAAFTLAL